MGYTTDFYGSFTLDKPLTDPHADYLAAFADTRHMRRDNTKLEKLPDRVREAVGLPLGLEGSYYIGKSEGGPFIFPDNVIDHNKAPGQLGYDSEYNALEPLEGAQPGLWCQWVPTEDLEGIEWDGGEKFRNYEEWLVYIINHFLKPWGYVLNGKVEWEGEDRFDRGVLIVTDNAVTTKMATGLAFD